MKKIHMSREQLVAEAIDLSSGTRATRRLTCTREPSPRGTPCSEMRQSQMMSRSFTTSSCGLARIMKTLFTTAVLTQT